MAEKMIYLEWDGPYSFDDLEELQDETCDYGIYQVYGMHPVYGAEVLLFLGKTEDRTFGAQLTEEQPYWEAESDFQPINIFVGRLAGQVTPNGDVWAREIDAAARLLAYAHLPVFNGRELGSAPDEDLKEIHIINWGNYMDLAPEVSGARWLYKFPEIPPYNIYGKHGENGD
jgi:hypothetical protein